MHGRGVNVGKFLRNINHLFRQGVDTAVDFGGVVVGRFFFVGNFFVDGEYDNFVVGEQIFIDGFAEIEPIKFLAVNFFVVH